MFYQHVANTPKTLHKCCKYMCIVAQLIFFHISLVTIVNGMWKNIFIIPHYTIFIHFSIFQKHLRTMFGKHCGKWNVEEYINSSTFNLYSSTFIHSPIFHISLEQRCGNIVENWNVEEYMECSIFHIYSSTFIHSSIFQVENNVVEK